MTAPMTCGGGTKRVASCVWGHNLSCIHTPVTCLSGDDAPPVSVLGLDAVNVMEAITTKSLTTVGFFAAMSSHLSSTTSALFSPVPVKYHPL